VDRLRVQSGLYVGVLADVGEVVEQQELVIAEWVIDEGDGYEEEQSDDDPLAKAPGGLRRSFESMEVPKLRG